MSARKFGLNQFSVFVQARNTYEPPKIKCTWLGHNRFQCGKCKKGYFNVHSESKHDDQCPECKYLVVIRWAD